MDAAAEIGRNPESTRFSVEKEQADAGRDDRTRLARPIPRRERGEKYSFSLVQLTASRIGNLNRLIHTLLYLVCDDHTYIHTNTNSGCGEREAHY